jgi:hypothetical protein
MPSAHAAVKDAPRRFAVPPTGGILDSRFGPDRFHGRRPASGPPHLGTARQPDRLQASTRFRHWSLDDLRGFERASFQAGSTGPSRALDSEVVLVRLLPDLATWSAPRRRLPTLSTRVCQDPRPPPCSTYVMEMGRDFSAEVLREQVTINPVRLSDDCLFSAHWSGASVKVAVCDLEQRPMASTRRDWSLANSANEARRLAALTKIVQPQESAPDR